MMKYILTGVFVYLASTALLAAEENDNADNSAYSRFSSNEPNYFVGAWDNHDDWHLEFNLSVKYSLWPPAASKHKLLFIYNGTYDFYLNSRDSSPIVSRRQNVGPAYQYAIGDNPNLPDYEFRIGWYHESNGQTINNATDYIAAGEFARDRVSLGWDYLGLEYMSPLPGDLRQHLDFRLFCNCMGWGAEEREDEIFWETLTEQPKINDYDGIRWTINEINLPANFGTLRLELKAGNRNFAALGNISSKFVFSEFLGFPLNIFYFTGYGREVGSYHERNQYLGVGIEMQSF